MKQYLPKAAVVGAQGYSGLVLAKLLSYHPKAQLAAVFSRDLGWHLSHDLSILQNDINHYHTDNIEDYLQNLDVVFLATPVEVSMGLATKLLASKVKVVDLSGAFRLGVEEFENSYQTSHTCPELLSEVVYGLSPWNNPSLHHRQFISNPGCYATCALMALLPLLKQGLIKPDSIIIDAKSGATGAGRQASRAKLFCELNNNFYPYKVAQHQHIPEINYYLEKFAGASATAEMITHLLPINQGISMTMYLDGINADEEKLAVAYNQAYKDYPLVKVQSLEQVGEQNFLSITKVTNTPLTHIAYKIKNQRIYLFATIDNLYKGAASQAIENFNSIYNLPVTTGLIGG